MGKEDSIRLHTGAEMPRLGLGTWAQTAAGAAKDPSAHAESVRALSAVLGTAIRQGCRHIDTAWAYFNEKAIGEVLQGLYKEGVVKREDLFITTKLFAIHHDPKGVEAILCGQLADLQTDYVDMYLIHYPVPFALGSDGSRELQHIPHVETWRAMEALVAKGLTRHIGVSNFNSKQVQRLLDEGSVPVANLQVECHAYFPQSQLKAFCDERGIAFTAYSPLGSPGAADMFRQLSKGAIDNPSPMSDPAVKRIAEAHGKSPAQVLIRYLLDRDIVVIPKSTNPERIKANFDVFDFKLSSAEVAELTGLGRQRLMGPAFDFAKDHEEYPFSEPF